MNEKTVDTKQSASRLRSAMQKFSAAAKRLWAILARVIRGREAPLPKGTGIIRRTAIGTVGVIGLVLFFCAVIPGATWGIATVAQEALLQSADEHATAVAEAKSKAAEAKSKADEVVQPAPKEA